MNGLSIVSTNITSTEDRYYSYSDFYSIVVSAIVDMGIEKAHIIEMSDFYARDKAELFRILSDSLHKYYNPANDDYQDMIITATSNINESILAIYKLEMDLEDADDIELAMEILNRDSNILEDLGFVPIKSISIENTIPAVFPNKAGLKLIEYFKEKANEQ